jgi:hypothetical protein
MKHLVFVLALASLTIASSAFAGKPCGTTPDGGTVTSTENGETKTWKCTDGKLTVMLVAPAPDYSKRPRR